MIFKFFFLSLLITILLFFKFANCDHRSLNSLTNNLTLGLNLTKKVDLFPKRSLHNFLNISIIDLTHQTLITKANFLSNFSFFGFSSSTHENATEVNSIELSNFNSRQEHFNELLVSSSGAYICSKTLAIINLEKKKVKDCNIFDLEKHLFKAFEMVKMQNLTVQKIKLDEMRSILIRCQFLIENRPLNSTDLINNKKNLTSSSKNILNGLVPGTVWCGNGDAAKNYSDLGYFTYVDSCCRQHDLCPVRLKSFETGYGITNFNLYTRSHCKCDKDFSLCLKKRNDIVAQTIHHLFFTILRVPCINPNNVLNKFSSENLEENLPENVDNSLSSINF